MCCVSLGICTTSLIQTDIVSIWGKEQVQFGSLQEETQSEISEFYSEVTERDIRCGHVLDDRLGRCEVYVIARRQIHVIFVSIVNHVTHVR